jgi:hypothetical protein
MMGFAPKKGGQADATVILSSRRKCKEGATVPARLAGGRDVPEACFLYQLPAAVAPAA